MNNPANPAAARLPRRRALAAAAAATTAALLGACSSGTASRSLSTASGAAGPLTIGMTYTPNVQFAPFYMSVYADGTQLRHHGAQEGQFEALLAGTEHLVVAGGDEAAVAASNGSDLVIIGGYYQRYPACLIMPQDSPITALNQLAGRTVGVPGRTGETWYALQLALETAGLTESDVTIQEIGFTQQAALVGGKVDAIVGFSNNDAVQIAQNGMAVRTLDVAAEVPLIGASLVTTARVLAARRDDLAAAVSASAKGMTRFVDDPDAAVETTRTYVTDLVDPQEAARAREVAVATGALVRPAPDTVVGSVSADRVAPMLDFLGAHHLLGPTTPAADAVCTPLLDA